MKRSGHTLLELVVSVSILSILLTAMGSVIAIASRAIPATTGEDVAAEEAADALRDVADETRYAIQFIGPVAANGRTLAFTIGDRDGDGAPERVEYAWSGVVGDPLTRKYNGGDAVAVATDVREFRVTPQPKQVDERYPGPIVEEDIDRRVLDYSSAVIPISSNIAQSTSIGQAFTLQDRPARPISWRPTEVRLYVRGSPPITSEETTIGIFNANSSMAPAGAALAAGKLRETALSFPNPRWETVNYTADLRLSVDATYCVVADWLAPPPPTTPGTSMVVYYEGVANEGATNLLRTSNGGASWNLTPTRGLLAVVMGRFRVQLDDQVLRRTYLTSIDMSLACGSSGAPTKTTRVVPTNMPEVLSASWRADFDTNPCKLDSNGDGGADWAVRSGQAITPADLNDGILRWQGTLDSSPKNNFAEPTTLDVRLRSTTAADTEVRLHADTAGGEAAPIYFKLRQLSSGTQTLDLYNQIGALSSTLLQSVEDLPDDFVRVRLLIDPTRDTVNLAVNGDYIGTYKYKRYGLLLADDRLVSVVSSGGSQCDWIDVRVGGEAR